LLWQGLPNLSISMPLVRRANGAQERANSGGGLENRREPFGRTPNPSRKGPCRTWSPGSVRQPRCGCSAIAAAPRACPAGGPAAAARPPSGSCPGKPCFFRPWSRCWYHPGCCSSSSPRPFCFGRSSRASWRTSRIQQFLRRIKDTDHVDQAGRRSTLR
jgi:hypothetical protein